MGMGSLFKPLTDKPSIYAKKLANKIDNPQGERGFIRGGIAGGIEGVGNLMSDMTSPFALAGSAVGAGPWMQGAKQLTSLGNIAHRIPGPMKGVGPSVNIPELVSKGGEDIYNAGRSIYGPAKKTVEDLAYEVVRRGGDTINKQLGGSFNIADLMRKTNAASGK